MTRENFVKNVKAIHDYQETLTRLEDILGIELVGSFAEELVDTFGNLILETASGKDLDSIPDGMFESFWNATLNYGDRTDIVEKIYEELTAL